MTPTIRRRDVRPIRCGILDRGFGRPRGDTALPSASSRAEEVLAQLERIAIEQLVDGIRVYARFSQRVGNLEGGGS